MTVPSSDALPELRAWAPEDAKLQWSWSRGKEDGGAWRLGIRAFGGPLTCAAWMSGDDDGGNATAKPGFFTRLLGRKATPRLPPSAANPSTVAGQDLFTEDLTLTHTLTLTPTPTPTLTLTLTLTFTHSLTQSCLLCNFPHMTRRNCIYSIFYALPMVYQILEEKVAVVAAA